MLLRAQEGFDLMPSRLTRPPSQTWRTFLKNHTMSLIKKLMKRRAQSWIAKQSLLVADDRNGTARLSGSVKVK